MPDFEPQQLDLPTTVSSVRTPRQPTRTNACIQNQYRHIRLDSFSDLNHLFEELRLLFMPTRRIDNDDIEPFLLEFCHTLGCY